MSRAAGLGTVRHDLAALEQHDTVGEADGGEAVGDHDRRAPFHEQAEGVVDQLLHLDVDRARGVVEDEDGRVDEQCAGDGDALTLAAREGVAPLADDGVVAERQLQDELVSAGGGGGRFDVGDIGRRAPISDVVPDRDREQERLVEHDADVGPQALDRHVPHVVAVDPHGAARDVVGPGEQARHRRLAGAGAADEGNGLAGVEMQVETRQHERPVLARVGEVDVVEGDIAGAVHEVDGAGPVDDLGALVEDLVDARGRGCRTLAHHDEHAEHHERRLHHEEIDVEGEDGADVTGWCGSPSNRRREARARDRAAGGSGWPVSSGPAGRRP